MCAGSGNADKTLACINHKFFSSAESTSNETQMGHNLSILVGLKKLFRGCRVSVDNQVEQYKVLEETNILQEKLLYN